MPECLQEQLMGHPPIGLQEDSGPINSPSLEIRIHLLPCDYEYWRDGLPCSINKADESHMAPSFTSNLGGNRSSTLANNLHWLHHSGLLGPGASILKEMNLERFQMNLKGVGYYDARGEIQ